MDGDNTCSVGTAVPQEGTVDAEAELSISPTQLQRHRFAIEHLFEEAYPSVHEDFLGILRLNRQGWVSYDVIAAHVHLPTAPSIAVVQAAASSSDVLVINPADNTVRRRTPMRKITLNATQNRTVVLENLPSSLDDIELFKEAIDLLLPWGPVQMLRLVHSKGVGETAVLRTISGAIRRFAATESRYLVLIFDTPEMASTFSAIMNGTEKTDAWSSAHSSEPSVPTNEETITSPVATVELACPLTDVLCDAQIPPQGLSVSIPAQHRQGVATLDAAYETLQNYGIAASYCPVKADGGSKGPRTESTASARTRKAFTSEAGSKTHEELEDTFGVLGQKLSHPKPPVSAKRDRASSSGSGLLPVVELGRSSPAHPSYDAFKRKAARSGSVDFPDKDSADMKWASIRGVGPSPTPCLESAAQSERGLAGSLPTHTPPRAPRAPGAVRSDKRDRAGSDGASFHAPATPTPEDSGRPKWQLSARRNSGSGALPSRDDLPSTPTSPHIDTVKTSIARGPTPDGHKGFTRRRTSTATGCELTELPIPCL